MKKNFCSARGRTRSIRGALILAAALLIAPPWSYAEEEREIHTVGKGAIAGEVELSGVFESRTMREIRLEPEVVTELVLLEVVAHGARVSEGDTLLKLDLSKVREQMEDLEAAQADGALGLAAAEDELKNAAQSTPLQLESAAQAWRVANENYAYFTETDRTQKEESARFALSSAEERLANAEEELHQLEQMYKEDDLTEETEEIILKRQRFVVEASKFQLKQAQLGTRRALETLIPREHETLKSAKLGQDLAHALALTSLPRALEQKRLAVEKTKRERHKAEEKLMDLKRDRRRLSPKAPIDGIVYYGGLVDGKWASGAAMAKKLVPGGKLTPKEVLMTLLDPDDLIVSVVVPEEKLGGLKEGQQGKAVPAALPDLKVDARLEGISHVPLPGAGGFAATFSFKGAEGAPIMPGMNCKITLDRTAKSDVLTVPKEAVFSEGDRKYVLLAGAGEDPEEREVETGVEDKKMIEVVKGLSEGDRILLKKP